MIVAASASVDQQVAACSHNWRALMSKRIPEVSVAARLMTAVSELTLI